MNSEPITITIPKELNQKLLDLQKKINADDMIDTLDTAADLLDKFIKVSGPDKKVTMVNDSTSSGYEISIIPK